MVSEGDLWQGGSTEGMSTRVKELADEGQGALR